MCFCLHVFWPLRATVLLRHLHVYTSVFQPGHNEMQPHSAWESINPHWVGWDHERLIPISWPRKKMIGLFTPTNPSQNQSESKSDRVQHGPSQKTRDENKTQQILRQERGRFRRREGGRGKRRRRNNWCPEEATLLPDTLEGFSSFICPYVSPAAPNKPHQSQADLHTLWGGSILQSEPVKRNTAAGSLTLPPWTQHTSW